MARAKIVEPDVVVNSAEPPAEAPKADSVRVMLLCDHVYLPDDPLRPDWASAESTRRYEGETEDGRRTKIDAHPSLADFLQKRKQAEILDG